MNCFNIKPKQGNGFIYKYTSPSGKSYIGQTCRSLQERAGCDGKGYVNCSIFFSAIQKYGFDSFKVEILEEVDLTNIDQREEYYIALFNTIQPNGYNIQKGGKCNYQSRGKRKSAVVKYDLQGQFLQLFDSVKKAAEDANCFYQNIEQVLSRTKRHYKGFIYRYLGEDAPEPIKEIKTQGKMVGQYSLDGQFIGKYSSANEAARAIGKDSNAGRNIRSVCAGKRITAYGFKWKNLE